MSRRVSHDLLIARNEVVAAPAGRSCEDHNFGLPPAIHLITATLFMGFVSVLCLALATPGLAVPFGIFAAFIVAFFTVPAIFVKASPDEGARALGWGDFMDRGIATEHGRCGGREATVLVLMLPAFIFLWAVTIAIIVALV
jgi:hypothetical protein